MRAPLPIRQARATDRAAFYDVGLRTGDGGQDASSLFVSRTLIGDLFAVPYLELAPAYAFVVEDGAGVCGYVVGTPDTTAFRELLEKKWRPMLRSRYPLPAPAGIADLERLFIEDFVHRAHEPAEPYLREYPAHFHINLLVERARGEGSRLLMTLFDAFRAGGVRGVHCAVDRRNERAHAFYLKQGARMLRAHAMGPVFGFSL